MYKKHFIGKIGENLSCKYLEKENYKILDRNFMCRQGEIDIIALEKNELVFIEVKTRSNERYGSPIESVSKGKIERMMKAIKYYLYKRNLENMYIRVDVIEIRVIKNKFYINHIKQVI